ncbi:MAG: hypothetical protein DRQ59_16210, partial [Gammaproteobacteria bacterium]
PGGEVFQGQGIYTAIKDYSKGSVSVIIGAVAASIASVIAYAGDTLPMVRINSSIMIHNPKTIAMGDEAEMIRTAEALRTVKDSLLAVYNEAMPDSDLDFAEMMNGTKWFSAQQAIDAGIAIPYEEDGEEITNCADIEISNKMSFEDLMRIFVKAKAKAESEIVTGDPEVTEDPAPPVAVTNEAARRRYTEIQTEDAQAGMA